jgi:asparagine synthase (glutamine-hydrolysing)
VPSTLDRMIYADLMTRFPEHTLKLSDRLGMAYGLEIRSPLLDVRLARYCFSMPARLRIRGRTTKYALRRAMREWLPPAALRRPKQGFMLPVADWLSGRGLLEVSAALAGCRLVQEQWVRSEAIERLLREHAARRADHHVRIWMLLSLDAWHRLYIDGEAIESPEPKPKSRAQVA